MTPISNNSNQFHVGQAIALLRKTLGWTQAELARRWGHDRSFVNQAARQWQFVPRTEDIMKLSQVFDVHIGYFLGCETFDSPLDSELTDLLVRRTPQQLEALKRLLRLFDADH